MRAYHLHVFFSLANLNIQKSLKHSSTRRGKAELSGLLARRVQCTRREPCLTDSKTERSSPSHHPASERTNSNRSLNKQTEKDVKDAHRARAERRVSKRINTALDWITFEFNKNESSQTENYSDTKYICLSFLLVGVGLYSSFMWGYQNKLWHIIPKDSSYSGLPVKFIKNVGTKIIQTLWPDHVLLTCVFFNC